jgi:2-octaprenyl-6-methoxyphenol hydroxylase
MPLQVMRIVDAGGEVAEPRVAHDFNAADISDKPFGWNLPNWLLRREMVARWRKCRWPISGPASAPRSC